MNLSYETKNSDITVECKKPTHFPPHIHEAIEMVYVTKGSLDLGVGQELYHMEKGDFAIVFPNLIHHYQVFQSGDNKALYMLISPKLVPNYMDEIQKNRLQIYVMTVDLKVKEHLIVCLKSVIE